MYSRQPPTIAPNRLAAKALVGLTLDAKRFAKITLAAMIGRKASTTATTNRHTTGSDNTKEVGTSQASSSPPRSTRYISGSGGVRKRRVTSTAASTAIST